MKPVLLGIAAFLASAAGLAAAHPQDAPPPPGGPMARGGGAIMRADANGDGVVTRQEWLAEQGRRFDRMDLNHDGKVDQTEMQQIGQRMHGMRGMGGDMPPPPGAGAPPPQQ